MGKFVVGIIAILLAIPVGLLGGLVLSDLWEWFIVPATGLQPISVLLAWGIMITLQFTRAGSIVQAANFQIKLNKIHGEVEKHAALTGMIQLVVVYLFSWGIGAILHTFL